MMTQAKDVGTYTNQGKDGHKSHDGQHIAAIHDSFDSVLDAQVRIHFEALLAFVGIAAAALVAAAAKAAMLDLDLLFNREEGIARRENIDCVLACGVVGAHAPERVAPTVV